jgi:5'-deoxynucleotidase YfbR-like HD superfamily hydrolase
MQVNKKFLQKKWSDKYVLKEVKALRVAYRMKRTLRYNTKRNFSVHSESVAEHVFALHFLALYFLKYEKTKRKLNFERISHLTTFHDFGEMLHGDVPYHMKTKSHIKQENKDAKIIFASLPSILQKTALKSWEDYNKQKSPEAKFVYALDKIEPLFELFDPINEHSMKRLKFSYHDHFNRKFVATENFPIMRRFVEVLSENMLQRKVFWKN